MIREIPVRWPFARDGTRELAVATVVFGGAAALALWRLPWAAPVPLVLLGFVFSFFRDPERSPPEGDSKLLSPADGRVADITEAAEDEFLGCDAVRIGIFMSIFNVHVNRAPVSGTVVFRDHRPGKFRNAMSAAASAENECSLIGIECAGGQRVLVKQIAGLIARRIVCACGVGDAVERGGRIGMVKFGSRLEVYVPRTAGLAVAVAVGDRVRAGRSVLGELVGDKGHPR